MKKCCKNIDIKDVNTVRPFIRECVYRHKNKKKFKKLFKTLGTDDLDEVINKLASLTTSAIRARTVPIFIPTYCVKLDSTCLKERLIGSETAYQQVFDYIAVRSCEELWRKRIVLQQCSSVKRRGQIYGVKMIRSYIVNDNKAFEYAKSHKLHYSRKCKYFVKLDVRHCYQSINHNILMNLLRHDIKNDDILYLWETLLKSYKTVDGCNGLLIGALPSQWEAQFILSFLYRYAMDNKSVSHTVMFMDDMVLFSGNRRKLRQAVDSLIKYASDVLSLTIKPNWHIKKLTDCGIDMMGYVVRVNGKITIRARNFIHARRLVLRYQRTGVLSYKQAKRLVSYKGFFKYSNCREVSQRMNLSTVFRNAQSIIGRIERKKLDESLL